MTLLRQISSDVSRMSLKMRSGAKRALFSESLALRSEFQQRSPVDSGKFQSGWKISRGRFNTGNSFAGVSIFNDTPYADLMELGATINQAPWYYPGSKKKSGKLVSRNGRIWAGGLNPGHSKTVGGAIGAGLFNNNRRIVKLLNVVADGAIGAIK